MTAETHAESPKGPEDDVAMGFFDHIGELRKRAIRAVIGLVPGIVIAWAYKEYLLDLFTRPLVDAFQRLGFAQTLHFKSLTDPFMAYMKISLISGVLIASPWIFWQIWQFIAPGLYRRERRLALPFVLASTVCFAGGAVFGYLIIFPMGFETLLGLAGPLPSGEMRLVPTIMIDDFLTFATRLLLAFGLVFEVPVVVTFLAAAGIVDWKQLLRFGRWWVVIAAVLAAILTPPDVGSMLMMLIPLILLYYMSVGLAFFFGTKKPREPDPPPA